MYCFTNRLRQLSPLGILITLAMPAVTWGVDVWLTRGDRQALLSPQPALSFAPGTGVGGLRIDVSSSQSYQSIAGFGAAMTDSSAWLIDQRMSVSQRDALMQTLFSRSGGISLNYLRVPMGASDFTASGFYTYNDLPPGQNDPTQTQFSIAHDEAYIIPRLQQAKEINPDLKLMAAPWSAPAWMKTNGSLFGGTLETQWHGSYATYLTKFVQAYAAAGLAIDTLSLQNEPLFTPSDYPSMGMSSSQQAELIRDHVGPAFAAAGIDTELLLYDHNWDNTAYASSILDDPLTRSYVAGTAFHGYAGDVTAQSTLHDAHPDKDIYFSEISGGEFAPNFDDNLVFGVKNIIIGNLRNWGRSALYWNLALDENYGPHLNGCSDCRGVVTIDSVSGDVTLNEEYYTLAHASKFVQPGAVRIDSVSIEGLLETVALRNPSGSKVMIALNPSSITRPFRIVEDDQFVSYTLPGKSVATIVWGVEPGDFNDDGSLDLIDLDQLVRHLSLGSNEPLFDVNGDGSVNSDDLTQWLADAGARNLASGAPYLPGDTNLDGQVDGTDFITWNTHKFQSTAAWSQADFNADGTTDGGDFVIWNRHKFTSSRRNPALPEPHHPTFWLWWVLLSARLRPLGFRHRSSDFLE